MPMLDRRAFVEHLLSAAAALPLTRHLNLESAGQSAAVPTPLRLEYARAAQRWVEALPIGGGRLTLRRRPLRLGRHRCGRVDRGRSNDLGGRGRLDRRHTGRCGSRLDDLCGPRGAFAGAGQDLDHQQQRYGRPRGHDPGTDRVLRVCHVRGEAGGDAIEEKPAEPPTHRPGGMT